MTIKDISFILFVKNEPLRGSYNLGEHLKYRKKLIEYCENVPISSLNVEVDKYLRSSNNG